MGAARRNACSRSSTTCSTSWQAEYLPEAKGLRLVGHQWSPRSHAIKDFLAGNLVPYRWLDVERDPDARALLDAAGVDADELPALFFEDGAGAAQPGAARRWPSGSVARWPRRSTSTTW